MPFCRKTTILIAISILCSLMVGTLSNAQAQDEDEQWGVPVNLSEAGAATNPVVAASEAGELHLFWQDAFAGYVYSLGSAGSWRAPVAVQVPFSDPPFGRPGELAFAGFYSPLLLLDSSDFLHGFWQDKRAGLWYSRVPVSEVAVLDSWTLPLQLAESVVAIDGDVGRDGHVHLGIIRSRTSDQFPAGVYYLRSVDSGDTWSDPGMLYQSDYLRSVSPGQANLQVEADGLGGVHVVWDNSLLDVVFAAHSLNDGSTWSEPTEIDKREPADAPTAAGPAKIRVRAEGVQLHLTWQAQHGTDPCSQFHQWSDDGGRTWEPRLVAFEGEAGCPTDGQLIASEDGRVFLMTSVNLEVYLQAWDGAGWSEPRMQVPLTSFIHPETYRTVDFACRLPVVTGNGDLIVVGCGTTGSSPGGATGSTSGGNAIGQDIWVQSRPLGELAVWFPLPETAIWRSPVEIISSSERIDVPLLVSDAEGHTHAIWTQTESPLVESGQQVTTAVTAVYYASSEVTDWTRPARVFRFPLGSISQPSAAVDALGRLWVVWSSTQTGEVLFSWANADRANVLAEWRPPEIISLPFRVAGEMEVVTGESGVISIAMAVPLNEDRGIYLVQSGDGGTTWSEPVQIFDGVAADWEIVNRPQVIRTSDDTLHALWVRENVTGGEGQEGIYYTRSLDDGETWEPFQAVVEEESEWARLVAGREGEVHRIWQEQDNNQSLIKYQTSFDSGANWSQTQILSSFGENLLLATVISDPIGQLHLLQEVEDISGELILRQWLFDGERWSARERLTLGQSQSMTVHSLTASFSRSGRLAVFYSATLTDPESASSRHSLFATGRSIELPAELPPPLSITPTAEAVVPEVGVGTSAAPEATATALDLASIARIPSSSGTGLTSGLILSGALAGLLVLIAFGIRMWVFRRK